MTKRLGLALGGGAARGLAHIVVLEALAELGVRPVVVAGTSIGAVLGAVYASGMPPTEMRAYALRVLGNRTELLRLLAQRWPGAIGALFNPFTPAMFNVETLLAMLLPDTLPLEFEGLAMPLITVATDFYAEEQVLFSSGPLIPAVAASAALPGLLKPVQLGDRVLIDGGFVNPTPFDVIKDRCDVVLAVDVTGAPRRTDRPLPTSTETWLGAAQIVLHSLQREKLRNQAPDILIRPPVSHIGSLEFFRVADFLAAAEPVRDEVKRKLDGVLGA